jgi:uncharacterized membrane protein YedE/YeeE
MIFDNFFDTTNFLLLSILAIAIVMGFTAQKTNFCTLGGISDWLNFNSKDRFNAWLLAIGTTLLCIGIAEYSGLIEIGNTFPNYRSNNFIWGQFILGGLIFGFSMTFASGCGNKTIIRVAEGDINSIIVWTSMAITAFYMLNPFPGSENTIFSIFFIDWISTFSTELSHPQDIGSFLKALFFADNASIEAIRFYTSIVIFFALLAWILKTKLDMNGWVAGLVIGLCTTSFWYVSTNAIIDVDGDTYTVSDYLSEWDMLYEAPEDSEIEDVDVLKLKNSPAWRSQSFSFVNPSANTLNIGYEATKKTASVYVNKDIEYTEPSLLLNMGIMAVIGVFFGSLVSALISKDFKFKFNSSVGNLSKNILSGVGMGVGGVLGLGCTIGQGITGVSTLSLGSVIVLLSIIVGSITAQKIIYWHLMRD